MIQINTVEIESNSMANYFTQSRLSINESQQLRPNVEIYSHSKILSLDFRTR